MPLEFRGHRLAFQGVADGGLERRLADAAGVTGLEDVVGGAEPHRFDDGRRRLTARQHDHLRRRVGLTDLAQRLDAVHAGHHHVEQHHVGQGPGAQPVEQRAAAVIDVDVVAAGAEQRLQIGAEGLVVVDDRETCRHRVTSRGRATPTPAGSRPDHTRPPASAMARHAKGKAKPG